MTEASDSNGVNAALSRSAEGFRLLVLLKLALKGAQIFLNFAVVRSVDPAVYGLTLYFLSMAKLQTLLSEDCFREAYQKRLVGCHPSPGTGGQLDRRIRVSSRNLVHFN